MSEKRYLIYLDILGFDKLAADIAQRKGMESRKVREDFLNVMKERVETTEQKGKIIGKNYGRRDDWLLVTDDLDKVFTSILEILEHNTGYIDYGRIPLEIAVGTAEFDKWARFEAEKLIVEEATIGFLKTYIVDYYRKWYEQCHNGQEVKSTFIVLTQSAYQGLEPLDRRFCKKIDYKHNKKDVVFFVADVDRVQQRGRVFEFLERIGHTGSKWYDRIDDVYISPLEYEGIMRALEENRVVFITGTPEYGKTYTAVRLMWQYYNRGYEPRWIRGGEREERITVRQRLEDIGAELKSRYIIYFEDPFGRREYERREGLERALGTIVESIKRVEDAYVIITSREEVFKEFEKEKLSATELKKFEKKLSVKKPSYDYAKRKDILLRWAEAENCKWLGNKELKNAVLKSMKDENILPTPLSIRGFVIATTLMEKDFELREQLKEKSKETERAFAKEIKSMTEDKILFLSFMFVSHRFEVEFVRVVYQELAEELGLRAAWEFNRVLNWFKDDKIEIFGECLRFSHSSYSKSLEHLLIEDQYITPINENIFCKLLLKLSERGEATGAVAKVVAENFDKLPEDARKLLFKLSERDNAAWAVAWAVAENFDKLPDNVRKLLFKLSERDRAAGAVAWAVAENFDRLPGNVRKLLFKLSEKDAAAWPVARAVAENFDRLPEDARGLLFKLSERNRTAWPVAWAVAKNFDKLPDDARKLLFKLSERDRAAGAVARVVAENFDKLPDDARNLLFKLSERDNAAGAVATAVAKNFDKLPDDARNLLFKLSERDRAAGAVAWAVAENFDRLPYDARNLLFKLSERDNVAEDVAWAVAENFDRLPDDARNRLLLKLSEKDKAADHVAWAVAENFDKLPDNVRKLLHRLQKP